MDITFTLTLAGRSWQRAENPAPSCREGARSRRPPDIHIYELLLGRPTHRDLASQIEVANQGIPAVQIRGIRAFQPKQAGLPKTMKLRRRLLKVLLTSYLRSICSMPMCGCSPLIDQSRLTGSGRLLAWESIRVLKTFGTSAMQR